MLNDEGEEHYTLSRTSSMLHDWPDWWIQCDNTVFKKLWTRHLNCACVFLCLLLSSSNANAHLFSLTLNSDVCLLLLLYAQWVITDSELKLVLFEKVDNACRETYQPRLDLFSFAISKLNLRWNSTGTLFNWLWAAGLRTASVQLITNSFKTKQKRFLIVLRSGHCVAYTLYGQRFVDTWPSHSYCRCSKIQIVKKAWKSLCSSYVSNKLLS